jgi:hypothetical protein
MAIGTAAAIIGGSVIGGATSLIGANKAAGAAKDASAATVAEQRRQFDLVRGDTAPYRQVGTGALSKLSQLYGLGGPSAISAPPAPAYPGRVMIPGDPSGVMGGMLARAYQGRMPTAAPSAGPVSNFNGGTSTPDMSVFFESPDYRFNLAEGQRAIDNSLVARGGALSGAGVKAGIRYASGMASREFGSFYDRLANLAGLGQTGVAQSAAAGTAAAGNIGAAYMNAGNARGSAYMAGAQGVNNALQGGLGNYLFSQYMRPG